MDIRFEFEGKKYRVGMEAYDKGGPIVLTDNTVLDVGQWLETMPPQAADRERNNELQLGSTPDETARLVNGTVAHEVTA